MLNKVLSSLPFSLSALAKPLSGGVDVLSNGFVRAPLFGFLIASFVYASFFGVISLQGQKVLDALEAVMPSEILALPEDMMVVAEPEVAEAHHVSPDEQVDHRDHEDVKKVDALLPAPFEGLTQDNQFGLLPVISANKLTPFQAYRKPYSGGALPNKALAIVVRDFGLSKSLSEAALKKLPNTVTLLLSPYAGDPDGMQKKARAAGFEIWMELPIETADSPLYSPGSRGIMSRNGLRKNKDNLAWVMGRTTGYAGIATYTDSTFNGYQSMLRGLLQDVFIRGLGYFEMNVTANDFSRGIALSQSGAYAQNALPSSVNYNSMLDIYARLKQSTEGFNGRASGVFPLNPALLNQINMIEDKAMQDGFTLVPLSALAD